MPNPRRRRSKAKKGMNRTHKKLHVTGEQKCSNCGESTQPHRICPKCGYYDGRPYHATVTKA